MLLEYKGSYLTRIHFGWRVNTYRKHLNKIASVAIVPSLSEAVQICNVLSKAETRPIFVDRSSSDMRKLEEEYSWLVREGYLEDESRIGWLSEKEIQKYVDAYKEQN